MSTEATRLSIVIPAYNEHAKVQRDIESASAFLADAKLSGEIILVDDGSNDGTAEAAAVAFAKTGAPGRVIRLEKNRGKGCAVRTGILASRGEFVLFADSGVCIPFSNALRGMELLTTGGCDIANGSRRRHDSVIRTNSHWTRRIDSWLFRHGMPFIAGTPRRLTDTQCGFKMYRGAVAREIYSKCTIDGFMFDIEVILLAVRARYKIGEFPVEWSCDFDSRLHPARYLPRMLVEIYEVRREVARTTWRERRKRPR